MSKYPNISKFMPELNIGRRNELSVNASDLEAVLANGVVVYGGKDSAETVITQERIAQDTHSGLLIGYQPIKSSEPVKVEEIIEELKYFEGRISIDKLISRIKRNGVK